MPSSTVENYLKQIYLLQERNGGKRAAMGKLAQEMNVVPGTATAMVKSLAEAGLVEYEPRGGVRLSRGGERLALRVIRRHRIVELFLVQILGLDWAEVHEEAEQLEHVISDKVLARMDQTLGCPEFDPHGDPIPPQEGKPAPTGLLPLSHCKPGDRVKVARVVDQDPEFLRFVQRQGLHPGATLTLAQVDAHAQAIHLRTSARHHITLGCAAAEKIFIQPLPARVKH